MATDFSIDVEDRPGGLASVGEALGAAGVNIEGVCGYSAGGGRGTIHVCVHDAGAARKALEDAGLTIADEADAILTEPIAGADRPGTLGAMARRVADAGINVRALYLATGSRGVVVTDDNARALQMMSS
jgi:hypothetical protein